MQWSQRAVQIGWTVLHEDHIYNISTKRYNYIINLHLELSFYIGKSIENFKTKINTATYINLSAWVTRQNIEEPRKKTVFFRKTILTLFHK